jgi:hypothetical protein
MLMSSLLRDEEEAYWEPHEEAHGVHGDADFEADLEAEGNATMRLSITWSKQGSVVRRGAGRS